MSLSLGSVRSSSVRLILVGFLEVRKDIVEVVALIANLIGRFLQESMVPLLD